MRECQERVPGAARSPRDGRLATAAAGRLWIGSTAGGCATGATARAGYCQRVVLLGAERTRQDAAARPGGGCKCGAVVVLTRACCGCR